MVAFSRGPIRGEIAVPGDKSISHRALILSALDAAPLQITNLNPGRDVRATRDALEALLRLRASRYAPDDTGESVLRQAQDDTRDDTRDDTGVLRQAQDDTGDDTRDDMGDIDCMNSGSTARMLLGVCAGANLRARFDGDASLRRRPMEPVAAQLRAFGAHIETTGGNLPLEIRGRDGVQTRSFILLSPSAQVKSALLFAALFARVPIDITGDAGSRDHTERLLRYQGAAIEWDGERVALTAPPTRRAAIEIPGDFSAAAFFITAATITPDSDVLVREVGVNPTRTGLLDALRRMGARIELRNERERCGEPIADIAVRHGALHGVAIDETLALRAIDEIPLLAVAAAFASGETTIAGIADLRTKESDRIAAIEQLLAAVGIETRALPRGLAIRGGSPSATGVAVASHGDHRIAMSAAVLATAAGPLNIDDADSAEVSFPGFLDALERARAAGNATP